MIAGLILAISLNTVFQPVFAYEFTANYLLNKMLKSREHLKTLEIEAKVIDENTKQSFKEVSRVDFATGSIHFIDLNEEGLLLKDFKTQVTQLKPLGLAWYVLGLDSNAITYKKIIDQFKIATHENESLKLQRIGKRPVLELGAGNVVQIEKDLFQLAGFRTEADDHFQVIEYGSSSGEFRFPKRIEFVHAMRPITYELKTIKVNKLTRYVAPETADEASLAAFSLLLQRWSDLVH